MNVNLDVSRRMSGVTKGRVREGIAIMMSLAVRLCDGMEGVIKLYVGESKV